MNEKIRLGADPFPPYQFYDKKGNLHGADYEIIQQAFLFSGFDIDVTLHPWDITMHTLDKGKLEGVFQVQPTEERLKSYCFSDLLRTAKTALFTRRGDSVCQKKKFLK